MKLADSRFPAPMRGARSGHIRTSLRRALALVLSIGLVSTPLLAEKKQATLDWNEFSQMMHHALRLRIVLPDGAHLEGYPLNVKPDSLALDVARTSDKKAHPKGRTIIPRDAVRVVQIRSPRAKGKKVGFLLGLVPGIATFASAVTGSGDSEAQAAMAGAGFGLAIFGGVSGLLIGRAVDRRFQEYIIVP
jgi:hypothetical protein